jgi:hypothetical protein
VLQRSHEALHEFIHTLQDGFITGRFRFGNTTHNGGADNHTIRNGSEFLYMLWLTDAEADANRQGRSLS